MVTNFEWAAAMLDCPKVTHARYHGYRGHLFLLVIDGLGNVRLEPDLLFHEKLTSDRG